MQQSSDERRQLELILAQETTSFRNLRSFADIHISTYEGAFIKPTRNTFSAKNNYFVSSDYIYAYLHPPERQWLVHKHGEHEVAVVN